MALIVEDGTGLSTATSYLSVSGADAYFLGNPYAAKWADGPIDAREWALIHSTRLIDSTFRWKGSPVNTDQSLDWPRTGTAYDETAVPEWLEYVTAELAWSLLESDRLSEATDDGGSIERVKVDKIEVQYHPRSETQQAAAIIPRRVRMLIPREAVTGSTSNSIKPLYRV